MIPAVNKIEIVENGKGEWFFRAIAENGETVAMSEMYTRRTSAYIEAAKLWPDAEIIDAPFERGGES